MTKTQATFTARALVIALVALATVSCGDHQDRNRLVATPAPRVETAADGHVTDAPSLLTDAATASQPALPTPMQVTEEATGCPPPLRVSVVDEGSEPSSLVLLEEAMLSASDEDSERRELTRAEAVAAGAANNDDPVWVYSRPDAPPCQATPGGFFIDPRAP